MIIENVQQIIDNVYISDLIGRYIKLRKVAKLSWGLCPFHSEKTPSFVVNEDKKFFYCFGCGSGGNIINFVSKYKDISFTESLREICATYNWEYKFSEANKDKYEQQKNEEKFIIQLFSDFANICHQKLMMNTQALLYLTERSVSSEMIRRFHMGYDDGNLSEMLKLGYEHDALKRYGILQENDWSQSRFKKRIILPICNPVGTIISLSSRSITEDVIPKYLHAIENTIFYKKTSFFNVNNCIDMKDSIYIVEGFFDMISMINAGVPNVVCSLGSTLSDEQCFLVSKHFKQINLIFDGDNAGIKGMINGATKLVHYYGNNKIQFLILPQGQDPGTFFHNKNLNDLHFLSLEEFIWEYSILAKEQIIDGGTIIKMYKNINNFIDSIESIGNNNAIAIFLKQYWIRKIKDIEKNLYGKNRINKQLLPNVINKDRILCGLLFHRCTELTEIIDTVSQININDHKANNLISKILNVVMYWENEEENSLQNTILSQLNPDEKLMINSAAITTIINCDGRSLVDIIQQEFLN